MVFIHDHGPPYIVDKVNYIGYPKGKMEMQAAIARIRAFNRYYTGVLGLLHRHFLKSRYSLTDARVLYEIAQNGICTAKTIKAEVGIDPGYLSRIIDSFHKQGLASRTLGRGDRRYREIKLTRKGKEVFSGLNTAQERSIETLVGGLSARERGELVFHMEKISELLGRRKRDGQGGS